MCNNNNNNNFYEDKSSPAAPTGKKRNFKLQQEFEQLKNVKKMISAIMFTKIRQL